MSIITYPLNGIEYTANDAETYLCSRTSGVFSAEDCFAARATGNDRNVVISRGLAWIRSDYFTGKSVASTEDTTITIPVSNGSLPRKDRIVLRWDANLNATVITVKQGSPSSSPVAPTLSRTSAVYELALCDINIPAGSIYVKPTDIESKLLDETVCGIMSDGVNKIPSQQLLEHFSNEFETWFNNVQSQLQGDIAGNLQNQINEINRLIATYDSKYVLRTSIGQANGVASLNSSGKVPSTQLPSLNYISTSQKGVANGVATLDENGKLDYGQIPVGLERKNRIFTETAPNVTVGYNESIHLSPSVSVTLNFTPSSESQIFIKNKAESGTIPVSLQTPGSIGIIIDESYAGEMSHAIATAGSFVEINVATASDKNLITWKRWE